MKPTTAMPMAAFLKPDTCASSCAGGVASPHPAPDHFTILDYQPQRCPFFQ
jgi:hypothetical protein